MNFEFWNVSNFSHSKFIRNSYFKIQNSSNGIASSRPFVNDCIKKQMNFLIAENFVFSKLKFVLTKGRDSQWRDGTIRIASSRNFGTRNEKYLNLLILNFKLSFFLQRRILLRRRILKFEFWILFWLVLFANSD